MDNDVLDARKERFGYQKIIQPPANAALARLEKVCPPGILHPFRIQDGSARRSLGGSVRDATRVVDRTRKWRDRGGTHAGDRRGRHLAPLKVLAAPRAQRPVEADEPAAVRADAVQACPAGRADDPFVVDAASAGRAALDRLDFGEERLFREIAFVDLTDLLVRPDDLVDEDRQREQRREDDDEARRDVRQDRVLGPLLHVAEGPVGGREPEDDQVDRDRPEPELHGWAAEEPA